MPVRHWAAMAAVDSCPSPCEDGEQGTGSSHGWPRALMAGQILVLHYTGRRSGQRYDVPVGYHLIDGVPTVFTNSGWRHNFADGPTIEVTYRGARRPPGPTWFPTSTRWPRSTPP
jgi:hypothetical protein